MPEAFRLVNALVLEQLDVVEEKLSALLRA